MVLGAVGMAFLSSCSKEDIRPGGSDQTFGGNAAYMTVVIRDNGTGTKATTPQDGFDYGVGEQTVGTAHFYFYDSLGEFVTRASVWNGGVSSSTSDNPGNIEFKSNTVIALENLSGKTYPMYLVTVLNEPTGFVPGRNLQEMRTVLSSPNSMNGGFRNEVKNFVMSTTSFAAQKNSRNEVMPYFVTEVKAENFCAEPVDLDNAVPVTVHVERLAAKVSLNVSESLSGTQIDGQRKIYPIHVTVAGDPNDEESEISASETLFVELLGWKLNATAKRSYMMKNLDEGWTNTEGSLGLGWTWNDPSNFRSYWAMSCNYGKGDYPGTSGGATEGSALNTWLTYVNLSDGLTPLGGVEYCAENTNTAGSDGNGLIKSPHSSALTSVVLKARLCDADGSPRGDMVRYENMLWESGHYLDYVMNALTDTKSLNAYYEDLTSEGEAGAKVYRQIDANYVELQSDSDGAVNVVLNEAAGSVTFYEKDAEGNITSIVADQGKISAALDEFNATSGAVGYKDGLMYYDIPIEHLNDNHAGKDQDGKPIVLEANYGVVRNHTYRITLTKLETVGKGIFNPDEVIVPTEDLDAYYVGTQVDILSWRIVDQEVEL